MDGLTESRARPLIMSPISSIIPALSPYVRLEDKLDASAEANFCLIDWCLQSDYSLEFPSVKA